jgi:hypothetical protein
MVHPEIVSPFRIPIHLKARSSLRARIIWWRSNGQNEVRVVLNVRSYIPGVFADFASDQKPLGNCVHCTHTHSKQHPTRVILFSNREIYAPGVRSSKPGTQDPYLHQPSQHQPHRPIASTLRFLVGRILVQAITIPEGIPVACWESRGSAHAFSRISLHE